MTVFLVKAVVQVIGIIAPVIATKDMPFLLFASAGGWNPLLLSDLHPASSQGWVQGYRRFVHKDELEICF